MSCMCFIVPREVLTRLAQDRELSAELRKGMFATAQISHEIRELRSQAARLTSVAMAHAGALVELAPAPAVTVYDCKHTQTTPGTPVPNPGSSADPTAKRTFNETTSVAQFYKDVFNRNSIDNHGMTVDEGHALSRVLTPGKDSRNDYVSYTHNFSSISKKMRSGCPAILAKRLGAYWTTTIGKKSVVVFKSDSHMSQDGPELPNIDVWRQIIEEVRPALVITTGTAGGIGKEFEVGDVIVSPIVRFDCNTKFKKQPFAQAHYTSSAANAAHFGTARSLFKTNAGQLPKENQRLPK